MPIEITMPRLSDTMEEGTLIRWRVNVGDKVKSGDLLADVETDKATMDLQSYDDGTVAQLAAQEGQSLPVGQLILVLAQEGESIEDAINQTNIESVTTGTPVNKIETSAVGNAGRGGITTTDVHVSNSKTQTPSKESTRIRVSPVAKRIADEKGIDLSKINGTGPDGRIIKRDVLVADDHSGTASSPPIKPVVITPAPGTMSEVSGGTRIESKTIPLTNMRKTIAKRLLESKTTIPHFTVSVTIDMTPLSQLRGTINHQLTNEGIKLSVNDFIVRASALALLKHPTVNSSWGDSGIRQHGAVHVGVAVALPEEKGGGLVVATIRDAPSKTLQHIGSETRALAKKAREQGLSLEEMSDGTFTVSNLGMFGVDHFEAIINPPQAAILAAGAAVERPIVREGKIIPGQEMTATLSADHRVIDGAMAAAFLQTLRNMLENPAILLV